MKRLIIFLLMILVFTACKSTKKLIKIKTDSVAHTSESTKVNELEQKEVKTYGDSLKGNSFASIDSVGNHIQVESKGIKLELFIKPRKDNSGKVIGHEVNYIAIAKPTETATIKKTTQTNAEIKANTQVAIKRDESEKTIFAPPAWVISLCWLIGFAVFFYVIYRIINVIKSIKP